MINPVSISKGLSFVARLHGRIGPGGVACLALVALMAVAPVAYGGFAYGGDVKPANPADWEYETIYLGYGPNYGWMRLDGGSELAIDSAYLAYVTGSRGEATIDGPGTGWDIYGGLSIGHNGPGAVTVSNGADVMTTDILDVGVNGTGTLEITGGAKVSANFGEIGRPANSVGEVTVDGAGSNWNMDGVTVGSEGDGTLVISNDGYVYANECTIGGSAGSIGSVTVDGAASIMRCPRFVNVGGSAGGSGTLFIKNGALVEASSFTMRPTGVLDLTIASPGDDFADVEFAHLGGTLQVELADGHQLAPGWQYKIIDVTFSRSGTFSGLGEGDLVGVSDGFGLFISYNGGDGNDVVLFTGYVPADLDRDGDCDIDDVDDLVVLSDLTVGVSVPPTDAKYDLDGNGVVNDADLTKWLADAATVNGFGSPYRPADTNLDRNVDISDFNTLASNFDPGAVNAATNGLSKGNFDGDNDVDITDFAQLVNDFAPGGYDSPAAAVAADADPGEVDLIVDLFTGEVSLEGNAAAISGLQVFSAGNSLLATDFTADVLQFVISTNTSTYAEGAFVNTGVDGQVSLGIMYDLLVNAQDLTFEYTMIGQPTVQGHVIYVLEPASLALMGMSGLMMIRRRRAA